MRQRAEQRHRLEGEAPPSPLLMVVAQLHYPERQPHPLIPSWASGCNSMKDNYHVWYRGPSRYG